MTDYSLTRADEAFLAELPWPQHLPGRSAPRTPRADVHLHDIGHGDVKPGKGATCAGARSYPSDHAIGSGGRR